MGILDLMARVVRQQVDERILDQAAALFARHGFAHTSLKTVADAVGLSKAGLLHHYPSKEALFQAARQLGEVRGHQLLAQVGLLPPGPARDRRAVELLIDTALDRPGLVALAFGTLTTDDVEPIGESFGAHHAFVFEMFAVDPEGDQTERMVRTIGALSALAVLSLAAHRIGDKTAWRPHIIATCLDALGHSRPGSHTSGSTPVED